ncbi:hypothetical protein KBA73_00720 [Patescibacteria group bacterium]|nr:hypothetical protein [Patescibacteria group bacterium]
MKYRPHLSLRKVLTVSECITRMDAQGPPVLTHESYPPAIRRYRMAIDTLYRLHKEGHVDPPHCTECEQARLGYRCARELWHPPFREDLQEEEVLIEDEGALEATEEESARGRFEDAQSCLKVLRQQGHVRQDHCELCTQARREIIEATQAIILGSRRLVAGILREYKMVLFADRVDLFQVGLSEGIPKALSRYHFQTASPPLNPLRLEIDECGEEWWSTTIPEDLESAERGPASFTTYAVHWLRSRMQRALDNAYYRRAFRVPVHQTWVYAVIYRTKRELVGPNRPTTTEAETIAVLRERLPQDRQRNLEGYVRDVFTRSDYALSFDRLCRPVRPTQQRFMQGESIRSYFGQEEVLVDRRRDNEGEALANASTYLQLTARILRRVYRMCLMRLMPAQGFVILRRLALIPLNERATLEIVGRLLNVTRERIRQLEERALRTLSEWLGMLPGELFSIRLAYDALSEMCPDEVREFPDYGRRRAEAEYVRTTQPFDSLDTFSSRLFHLSEKVPLLPIEPYRMSLLRPNEFSSQEIDIAYLVLSDSVLQARLLSLHLETDATGSRRVRRPDLWLQQEAFLTEHEALYVLLNLLLRQWITCVPLLDRESHRFHLVEILWTEGTELAFPDRPVVAYDEARLNALPTEVLSLIK